MTIPAELTNMCMLSCGGKVLVQNRVDPLWKGITFPGGMWSRANHLQKL